jgi:hypothetical protein
MLKHGFSREVATEHVTEHAKSGLFEEGRSDGVLGAHGEGPAMPVSASFVQNSRA